MRVFALFAAVLVVMPATAQPLTPSLLWTLDSPHPASYGYFGHSVAVVGDLDGDGTDDLAVGAPGETSGGALSNGRVYLVSGATGAILRELTGQPDADGAAQFGFSVAGVGDLDGDGVADVAVGARSEGPDDFEPGAAYAFSGATGARLYRWGGAEQWEGFGRDITALADATGDGVPEVVVAALGRLSIFDGATGQPVRTLVTAGGDVVVAAGDLDGDGVVDLAKGQGFNSGGAITPGQMEVYSGATGTVLRTVTDPEPGGIAFAGRLASAGDLDGDGLPEMAASAYRSGAPGRVLLFDGATGSLVRTIHPPQAVPGETYAFPRAMAAGDADGDGVPDLAVSTFDPSLTGNVMYVFSGATGAVLAGPFSESGTQPGRVALALSFIRESDGATPAMLAAGAPGYDLAGGSLNVGRVYAFTLGRTVAAPPSPETRGLSVSVSPVPSSGAASVSLSVPSAGAVRVSVVDALGRTVATVHDGPFAAGRHRLALPPSLAPGVYVVRVSAGEAQGTARWIVAR